MDNEDIIQMLRMEMFTKILGDYNPDKGNFDAFCKLALKRHTFTKIKQANKKRYRALNESLSIDMPSSIDDSIDIADLIEDKRVNNQAYEELESNTSLINELKEYLTKIELLVLENYRAEGDKPNYKGIAAVVLKSNPDKYAKFSQPQIYKVVDNALERVRRKAKLLEAGNIRKKGEPKIQPEKERQRYNLPYGVAFNKNSHKNPYVANVYISHGRSQYIGSFPTIESASEAVERYREAIKND